MILAKGNFVSAPEHPEYGVGRVIAVDVYVTRVLFPGGGVRVYREDDLDRLKSVRAPGADELAVLDQKEGNLSRGVAAHLAPPKKKTPAKKTKVAPADP